MLSDPNHDPTLAYEVTLHRAVRKYLRTHPDLDDKWSGIVDRIQRSPRLGSHIDHLKGDWRCSYRWDEGSYRIKYDVNDNEGEIYVYDANNRGDVYKGRSGAGRRR